MILRFSLPCTAAQINRFVFPRRLRILACFLQTPQSEGLPILIPCPNRVHNVGENRDCFVLDPETALTQAAQTSASSAQTLQQHLAMTRFLGVLMGVAVRTQNPLNLDLPAVVLKPVVDEPLTRADIAAIDHTFECLLQLIEHASAAPPASPSPRRRRLAQAAARRLRILTCLLVPSLLFPLSPSLSPSYRRMDPAAFEGTQTWTVDTMDGVTVALRPGGHDTFVRFDERAQYVEAALKYRSAIDARLCRAGTSCGMALRREVVPTCVLAFNEWWRGETPGTVACLKQLFVGRTRGLNFTAERRGVEQPSERWAACA